RQPVSPLLLSLWLRQIAEGFHHLHSIGGFDSGVIGPQPRLLGSGIDSPLRDSSFCLASKSCHSGLSAKTASASKQFDHLLSKTNRELSCAAATQASSWAECFANTLVDRSAARSIRAIEAWNAACPTGIPSVSCLRWKLEDNPRRDSIAPLSRKPAEPSFSSTHLGRAASMTAVNLWPSCSISQTAVTPEQLGRLCCCASSAVLSSAAVPGMLRCLPGELRQAARTPARPTGQPARSH
uniref:Protein kinase domain-containing protein n=1 Tax=Macrostomum lignano TaxID=282301 RepID=A0A1I8FDU8_9PLAT